MADAVLDLWPPNIALNVRTPIAILRIQASLIESKTKGLLRADISVLEEKDSRRTSFDLVAPALANTRERILELQGRKNREYPVQVHAPCYRGRRNPETSARRTPVEAINAAALGIDLYLPDYQVANTEEEFIRILGEVLASDNTASVINSMLAQSNEVATTTPANG